MYEDFRSQLRPRFTHRERVLTHIAWLLLAVMLIAAALGLFGDGPLSKRTVTEANPDGEVSLTYSRWGRANDDLTLQVIVVAPSQGGSEVRLVFSRDFADRIEMLSIVPEPDSTSFGDAGFVYAWAVESWEAPVTVTIHYQAHEWRTLDGHIAVQSEERTLGSFSFSQFLFP